MLETGGAAQRASTHGPVRASVTLAVAGFCFLLVGVTGVVSWAAFFTPLARATDFNFLLIAFRVATCLLAIGGLGTLAFGVRGEPDAVGGSRVARVALLLAASYWIVSLISRFVIGDAITAAVSTSYVIITVAGISTVAATMAAVSIARAGTIGGVTRWLPFVVIAAHLVQLVGTSTPVLQLLGLRGGDQTTLIAWFDALTIATAVSWIVLGAALIYSSRIFPLGSHR